MFETSGKILIPCQLRISNETSTHCPEISVVRVEWLEIFLHASEIISSCSWSELSWFWKHRSCVRPAELNWEANISWRSYNSLTSVCFVVFIHSSSSRCTLHYARHTRLSAERRILTTWLCCLFKYAFVLLFSSKQLIHIFLQLLVLDFLFLIDLFVVNDLFQEKIPVVLLTEKLDS